MNIMISSTTNKHSEHSNMKTVMVMEKNSTTWKTVLGSSDGSDELVSWVAMSGADDDDGNDI